MGCNASRPDDNSGTTATPRQTTTTTAVAAAPGTAHKAHKLTFSSSISSCSVSQPPPHGSLANFPHGDGSWVGDGGTCASSTSAGAHRERTGSNSSSSSNNNNNDGSGSAQPQHHQQQQPQNQQDLQTLRQRAVEGLKAQQQQQPHARPARVQMRVCDPSGRRLQLDLAPPPPSPLAAAAVAAAGAGGGGGGAQQQQQLQQQYSSVGGASFARNTTMRLASACTFSTQDSSFSVLDQDMSPRTAGDTHVDFTGAAAAEASWYGAPVTLQPAAREAYPQRPSRPASAAVATATTGNKTGCRRVAPEGVPSSIMEAPTRDGHAAEEGEEPEEEEEEEEEEVETEGDDDGATRGGATAASLPSLVEDATAPHGQVAEEAEAGEAATAAAGASHSDVHLGFGTSSTPSSAASIGVDDFHVVIGGR